MKSFVMALLVCIFMATNSVAAPPDHHFSAAGEVFIQAIDKSSVGIVFFVDGETDVRHLFRIWSDAAVPQHWVVRGKANLEYRGNHVFIRTAYGNRYVFVLKGGRNSDVPAPRAHDTIEAIGINHEVRSTPCGTNDDCVRHLKYEEREPAGAGGCSSGGPGSRSCSVTKGTDGNAVSCSPGYYACCKDATKCGCVKNP